MPFFTLILIFKSRIRNEKKAKKTKQTTTLLAGTY